MRKKVTSTAQGAAIQEQLPPRVQEALGELASAAREGLLALSVGVGLGVLAELMEEKSSRLWAPRAGMNHVVGQLPAVDLLVRLHAERDVDHSRKLPASRARAAWLARSWSWLAPAAPLREA